MFNSYVGVIAYVLFTFSVMKYKFNSLSLRFNPLPFKCGVSKDTEAVNETNIRLQELANQANRDIANSTNATNRFNVENTNAANIQMNEANNMLQRQLQREMNEYNSVGAQLERARAAGVNPNAVISGTLSGNLQNSLPSTTAGHSDAPIAELGAPMQAAHAENAYAERLATVNTLNQLANDFFNRANTGAQTDLTRNQATQVGIDNETRSSFNRLQLGLGRKQMEKFEADIASSWQQRNVLIETANQLKANVANMNEDTRTKWLNNYFSVEKRNSYIEYVRNHYDELGIPRKSQLSDNDLIAIRYGVIGELGVPMSQKLVNESQNALNNSSVGVNQSIKAFNNAKTKGQYIQNALDTEFGAQERKQGLETGKQGIEESKSRVKSNDANTKKQNQNYVIDNWKTSKWSQSQFAAGVALDNAQKEANIDNTKVDTAKKTAETAESVSRSANNLMNLVPGL